MKKNRSMAQLYRKYGIVGILIILFIISALVNRNFLKPRNLINILTQISVVTIIACGEEMLIVSGLIDLSAGLICTGSACFSAGVLVRTGSVPLAVLTGLAFGALCGWINGFLVTHFKLQAFIATLAAAGSSGVAGGSLLLIPMACSLFGVSQEVAMQVVAVGFIIGVVQDSVETALNSSGDVLFAASAEYAQWRKTGKSLPVFLGGTTKTELD